MAQCGFSGDAEADNEMPVSFQHDLWVSAQNKDLKVMGDVGFYYY